MKYRKKPVVIDAMQWTGDNYAEIFEFTEGNAYPMGSHSETLGLSSDGEVKAEKGCYIIRVGETYYPYPEAAFNMKYEPVKQ
jgi:hypothetical protein